jgi:hypothetical protein
MKSGRNTWSNEKNAFLVSLRGTVGLVASVYLVKILGFARLRPSKGLPYALAPGDRDDETANIAML